MKSFSLMSRFGSVTDLCEGGLRHHEAHAPQKVYRAIRPKSIQSEHSFLKIVYKGTEKLSGFITVLLVRCSLECYTSIAEQAIEGSECQGRRVLRRPRKVS